MVTERAAAAGLCLAGALALRAPAYGLPLDRDSAVYAVVGRGLRHGELPYRDLIDHKQPLVYPVYALLDWVAPRSASAIHVASAVLGGLAAWVLFLALRRYVGLGRAAVAAGLAVLLGASRYVEGFGLNTEHLMTLLGTLAIALALLAPRQALWVGVLIGLAILGKAVGVLLAPAALAPLLLFRRRSWVPFAIGAALPLVVVAVFYALHGAFGDLWTWNWTYNRQYTAALSLDDRVAKLHGHLPLFVVVAAAGCAAVLLLRARGWRDPLALTLSLWLAGAFVGGLVGGYGYAHYFFPVVPPAAALLATPPARLWPVVAAVAVLPFAFDLGRSLVRGSDWLAQRAYGGNARVWDAYAPVGRQLRALARPGDRLYVSDNEAGFYWQSGLQPASRLLYEAPLDLRPSLLPEVQRDVCGHPPRFLVLPSGTAARLPCLGSLGYVPVPGHDPAVAVLERG